MLGSLTSAECAIHRCLEKVISSAPTDGERKKGCWGLEEAGLTWQVQVGLGLGLGGKAELSSVIT